MSLPLMRHKRFFNCKSKKTHVNALAKILNDSSFDGLGVEVEAAILWRVLVFIIEYFV